jgi:succinate dehydrogenase / fumarate reductase flavoprotein subunit
MSVLDSKAPEGPIANRWTDYKNKIDLVNPANKRNIDVIVVGTGLAGGSASATLAELGYNVKSFAYQDSPRRAHSIAAQGGINAAKKLSRGWRFKLSSFLRYGKRRGLQI